MRPLTLSLTLPFLLPALAHAQQDAKMKTMHDAMSAAPMRIAHDATIKNWDGTVLREGSNGWVCYPDMPETPGHDPMCLDRPWQEWLAALMAERAPRVERMGFGYMLAGGSAGSNLVPMAPEPTPDNEWLEQEVPHLMIIVPDAAQLAGLPTHPDQADGGPWVMWRGTPYAHIMVPMPKHEMPMQGMRH